MTKVSFKLLKQALFLLLRQYQTKIGTEILPFAILIFIIRE